MAEPATHHPAAADKAHRPVSTRRIRELSRRGAGGRMAMAQHIRALRRPGTNRRMTDG